MKSTNQWEIEFEQRVEREEHPNDRKAAFDDFIRDVQSDAQRDLRDKYRKLAEDYNELVLRFDGLRESF